MTPTFHMLKIRLRVSGSFKYLASCLRNFFSNEKCPVGQKYTVGRIFRSLGVSVGHADATIACSMQLIL
jgi:hypothetical protein